MAAQFLSWTFLSLRYEHRLNVITDSFNSLLQVFPLGFLEFIMTETGQILREGPRTEKDEAAEDERWQVIQA